MVTDGHNIRILSQYSDVASNGSSSSNGSKFILVPLVSKSALINVYLK